MYCVPLVQVTLQAEQIVLVEPAQPPDLYEVPSTQVAQVAQVVSVVPLQPPVLYIPLEQLLQVVQMVSVEDVQPPVLYLLPAKQEVHVVQPKLPDTVLYVPESQDAHVRSLVVVGADTCFSPTPQVLMV